MTKYYQVGKYQCEKITKKQADYILKSFYKYIQNYEVSVTFSKKLQPWHGLCIYENGVNHIVINPNESFIKALIHELLHVRYVDIEHDWIYAMEYQLVELLSDRQLENLMKKVCDCSRFVDRSGINIDQELQDHGHPNYKRRKVNAR